MSTPSPAARRKRRHGTSACTLPEHQRNKTQNLSYLAAGMCTWRTQACSLDKHQTCAETLKKMQGWLAPSPSLVPIPDKTRTMCMWQVVHYDMNLL